MTTKEKVTCAVVPGRQRMRFLPAQFGIYMMEVEARVYRYAELSLGKNQGGPFEADYKGGVWEFVAASNGSGYLRPKKDEAHVWRVRCLDGSAFYGSDQFSNDAAGLFLTVMALNHTWHGICNRTGRPAPTLERRWRGLMEVVHSHAEVAKLVSALD